MRSHRGGGGFLGFRWFFVDGAVSGVGSCGISGVAESGVSRGNWPAAIVVVGATPSVD